jgi:hypothetical protein
MHHASENLHDRDSNADGQRLGAWLQLGGRERFLAQTLQPVNQLIYPLLRLLALGHLGPQSLLRQSARLPEGFAETVLSRQLLYRVGVSQVELRRWVLL